MINLSFYSPNIDQSEVINMSDGHGLGHMCALVVVLFVLLIIIGCSCSTLGGY